MLKTIVKGKIPTLIQPGDINSYIFSIRSDCDKITDSIYLNYQKKRSFKGIICISPHWPDLLLNINSSMQVILALTQKE